MHGGQTSFIMGQNMPSRRQKRPRHVLHQVAPSFCAPAGLGSSPWFFQTIPPWSSIHTPMRFAHSYLIRVICFALAVAVRGRRLTPYPLSRHGGRAGILSPLFARLPLTLGGVYLFVFRIY